MISMTEPERVDRLITGETPPPVHLRIVGRCTDAPGTLERIRHVMRTVASQRVHREEGGEWPAEAWWHEHLPTWFFDSFEQVLENEHMWHIDSWADAMKAPGWEWWSSSSEPGRLVINLWVDSWPYAIGVFEYLVRVAGTDDIEITEMDPG